MNKYQEALNIYSCLESETTEDEYTPLEYRKARHIIHELVEKATPKKPIKDRPSKIRYVQTYICPSCRNSFSSEISRFCYHCGQALDWSDEE